MDWTSNGLNLEWTKPRMDPTPAGLNLEWTEPRMYWTSNGPNSEWTELRMDSTPTGLNPDWTQPQPGLNHVRDSTLTGTQPLLRLNPEWTQHRLRLKPEWTELRMGLNLKFLSTSNGVQCHGVHISKEWISKENTSVYFSRRRLSGPQHSSSAPCWRSWNL